MTFFDVPIHSINLLYSSCVIWPLWSLSTACMTRMINKFLLFNLNFLWIRAIIIEVNTNKFYMFKLVYLTSYIINVVIIVKNVELWIQFKLLFKYIFSQIVLHSVINNYKFELFNILYTKNLKKLCMVNSKLNTINVMNKRQIVCCIVISKIMVFYIL